MFSLLVEMACNCR